MLATAIAGVLGAALTAVPTAHRTAPAVPPDSAAILATVTAFHAALAAGDSTGAIALLAPDAVILEGGELESRAQYAAHHLGADIAFTRAVTTQRLTTQLYQDGAVAWVAATTTTRGTFRERPVASQGAELMVLSRTDAGWRIRAIHWSSQRL